MVFILDMMIRNWVVDLPAGAFQWPNVLWGANNGRGPTLIARRVWESMIVKGGGEEDVTEGVPSAAKEIATRGKSIS